MFKLYRGLAVIIDDSDRPSAQMVCILDRFEEFQKLWHAAYLLPDNCRAVKPYSGRPTPITAFGRYIVTTPDLRYYRIEALPDAKSTATYRDGVPRFWQETAGLPDWLPISAPAANVLRSLRRANARRA